MTKSFILPFLFLIAAGVIFFVHVESLYERTEQLQATTLEYEEALHQASEIRRVRDDLLIKYNNFSTEDLNRLYQILPDSINNVGLIMDVEALARDYSVSILKVDAKPTSFDHYGSTDGGRFGTDVGSLVLSLEAEAKYDDFRFFLKELERSLSIFDVELMKLTTGERPGINRYEVRLNSYWLK
jgi:hypothetical protein